MVAETPGQKPIPLKLTIVLALLLVGFAVEIRWRTAARLPEECWNGSESERVARSLINGGGFADAFCKPTGPTAHVAPLYPTMLAGIYAVFGDFTTSSGRLAEQIFTITISVIILLLLPVLAGRLKFHPAAGWAGAFLAAWLPAHRDHEASGGHDQMLAALLLILTIITFATAKARNWPGRSILTTGLLTGLLGLNSPNLAIVPAFMFLGEILATSGVERRRVFRVGLTCGAIGALMIAPWMVRNYVVLGGFVPVRSNFGLEIALGNHDTADGHSYCGPVFHELLPFTNPAVCDFIRANGELAYMKARQRQAIDWIANHPQRFAWLMARRAFLYWFTADEKWYELTPALNLKSRIYGLIGLAVLVELIRLICTKQFAGRMLALGMIAVVLPYLPTHVEMRYRFPIVGIFAVVACHLFVTTGLALWRSEWIPFRAIQGGSTNLR